MLSTARVDIPGPIASRLNKTASFDENVNEFAREDLVGFKRPLAAAFALIAPVALAFVYQNAGPVKTVEAAILLSLLSAAGIFYVGSSLWPTLVSKFEKCEHEKRRAIADLRCGFGEASFLSNGRAPRYFEHEYGVLALADAGDLKTLFFSIQRDESDPRWALFEAGELNRRIWRWLRLPVSRDVVSFSTEGTLLGASEKSPMIDSIEVWEAVNVALGEPLDGAVIHRPFDELVEMVERLL